MLASYLVSLFVVVGTFLFAVVVSAGNPAWYLDLPSAAVIFVLSFAVTAGDYGWKGISGAFSAAFGKRPMDEDELRSADAAARALGRYAWYAAVLGVFVGTIAILGGITDPGKLGPNFAVALICPLYALLFNFILIAPMRNRIQDRVERGR